MFSTVIHTATSSTEQTYTIGRLPQIDGYNMGYQLFNSSDSEVTIAIQCDDMIIDIEVIPPFSPRSYSGRNPLEVPPGFSDDCEMVLDERLVGTVNILDSGGNKYASYRLLRSGSETVYLPLLTDNLGGFTTWYVIQNVGSSEAIVNVSYSDGVMRNGIRIAAGESQVFYQGTKSDGTEEEDHVDGSKFAATITSDQPIVAFVIQESDRVMFAYNGFTGGTTDPIFPLVNQNNNGYRTGLQLQNIGDQATEVTLEYMPSKFGNVCEETITIEPSNSATYALRTFQGRPSPGISNCRQERFVGSARVTRNSNSQPLVGIGNQLVPGVSGEAYGTLDASDVTNKVLMPLIMDRRGDFNTGFSIQHAGGPASQVDCTFSDADYTISQNLAVDGSFTTGQRNQISEGYAGAGICTAAGASTKIIAVVNQVRTSSDKDLFLVYEGIAVSN